MKDVIGAAAGIAGFAIESARDLVQYMVRRGQMTPEEGGAADPRSGGGARKAVAGREGKGDGDKARVGARGGGKGRGGRPLCRCPRSAICETGLQNAGRRAVERSEILRGIDSRAQDGAGPLFASQGRSAETSADPLSASQDCSAETSADPLSASQDCSAETSADREGQVRETRKRREAR